MHQVLAETIILTSCGRWAQGPMWPFAACCSGASSDTSSLSQRLAVGPDVTGMPVGIGWTINNGSTPSNG